MNESPRSAWQNNRWAIHPEDVSSLWTHIGTLNMSTGHHTRIVWRGMANEAFEVTSSLVRELEKRGVRATEDAVRSAEEASIQNVREWGIGTSEHGHASDLHLLAMMQHHSVPTRLIDVTYNPLTALWFACSDIRHSLSTGVLVGFMVGSAQLIKTVPAAEPPTYGSMQDPYGFQYKHSLGQTLETGLPLLVEPAVRDARMVAQEGLFITSAVPESRNHDAPVAGILQPKSMEYRADLGKFLIEGKRTTPTMLRSVFAMVGFTITPQIKNAILPVLNGSFNRSYRTMYPDFSGFATYEGTNHVSRQTGPEAPLNPN
ncbi:MULTISPECIES: FRG domain-containing protein [unclassified Arthrobacter]|uniref:FRG domain-containing protein n=1 Tax=unclassified Arthrobacter TaxID=235627 RepID=UPI001C85B19D|nr:FRG domain-containing protein [Arthrobacter sp. MAHUQ-56]MBX7442919.1 FRG domain-containing protein [Arthrobacter sp. MAHUQ-56]